MNSNRAQKALTTKLTPKQTKFLEIYNDNETKDKQNKVSNKKIAELAGYKGNNFTLATTAHQTIKALTKKGIIQTFEEKELNEDLITNTLKDIITNLNTDNIKTSDVVSALKIVMQARGDLTNQVETYEQTIKAELKGLTEAQLEDRLLQLRSTQSPTLEGITA